MLLFRNIKTSFIPSKAFSRSSADHDVGAALNGAAKRIPSRLAILYSVEEGMPNAFEALFAEIVPVRSASSALLSDSSFHVFVGPSFFGVSVFARTLVSQKQLGMALINLIVCINNSPIPKRCARCHKVVDGIP